MKQIIYTRTDGGLDTVVPEISRTDPEGFTEDDALQRALSKDVPADAINMRVVDEADIPTDREYRNAWEDDGAAIRTNIEKARTIFDERVRREKVVKARELRDREDAGEDVTAERDALRAVNPDSRAAQTLDELKALWPKELNRQ